VKSNKPRRSYGNLNLTNLEWSAILDSIEVDFKDSPLSRTHTASMCQISAKSDKPRLSYTDDATKCPGAFFRLAILFGVVLRLGWIELTKFGQDAAYLSEHPKYDWFSYMLFRFEIRVPRRLLVGRKTRPYFALFTSPRPPVKLWEGWAKCLSQSFKFSLGTNLWCIFGAAGYEFQHFFPACFLMGGGQFCSPHFSRVGLA